MKRLHWDKYKRVHVGDLTPTRRSLISRLKRLDDEAWHAFFDVYWQLIYSAAREVGLTDAEAEDVVQETVISVWKAMPQFRYDPKRGSFRNWLLQTTFWRIKDQWRRRKRESRESHFPLANTEDPESSDLSRIWDEEWESTLMKAAMERVKMKADSKNFQLFELYVLQEWPIAKIQSVLNVSAARVYVAKHRISVLVKKELKHLQTHWF